MTIDIKKAKSFPLAPIAVKILLYWGSVQEIVAESGTMPPKTPNVSASRKKQPSNSGLKHIFAVKFKL